MRKIMLKKKNDYNERPYGKQRKPSLSRVKYDHKKVSLGLITNRG